MPRITLQDDILAPTDTILMRYEGRNPFAAIAMVMETIRYVLKVSTKDVFETDVRWDTTTPGEMRDFYGRWLGKRKEDRWTTTFVRIIIQGQQHATEKKGWCRIELKGYIKTEYEYTNFIQRSFWWFYSLFFYWRQRRAYIENDKDDLYEMKDRFQRALGVLPPKEA